MRARPDFRWLVPPAELGEVTILDIVGAPDLSDDTRRVERWAQSVWDAWRPHHGTVRASFVATRP
ncbi:MAG: DUF5946 family protein [Planctomycetota bacterium]|jgi:hypothetical protein